MPTIENEKPIVASEFVGAAVWIWFTFEYPIVLPMPVFCIARDVTYASPQNGQTPDCCVGSTDKFAAQ